jgi:hypothetical protein
LCPSTEIANILQNGSLVARVVFQAKALVFCWMIACRENSCISRDGLFKTWCVMEDGLIFGDVIVFLKECFGRRLYNGKCLAQYIDVFAF